MTVREKGTDLTVEPTAPLIAKAWTPGGRVDAARTVTVTALSALTCVAEGLMVIPCGRQAGDAQGGGGAEAVQRGEGEHGLNDPPEATDPAPGSSVREKSVSTGCTTTA